MQPGISNMQPGMPNIQPGMPNMQPGMPNMQSGMPNMQMGGMQSVGMQQQQQPSTQPGFGQFNTRGSVPSQNYSGNMSGGFSGNPQSLQQLGNCS